jgi:hypothetical protein
MSRDKIDIKHQIADITITVIGDFGYLDRIFDLLVTAIIAQPQ